MEKNLVKTVLVMEDITSKNPESKEKSIMLIRREGDNGNLYERLDFDSEGRVKGIISNKSITAEQYISLIERHFDEDNNKSYYFEVK